MLFHQIFNQPILLFLLFYHLCVSIFCRIDTQNICERVKRLVHWNPFFRLFFVIVHNDILTLFWYRFWTLSLLLCLLCGKNDCQIVICQRKEHQNKFFDFIPKHESFDSLTCLVFRIVQVPSELLFSENLICCGQQRTQLRLATDIFEGQFENTRDHFQQLHYFVQ